jgi:hypothetical protein
METNKILPDNGKKALTSIHDPYTLSNTDYASEVDELTVKNFLNTLAEVALAIASRKVARQ